MAEYGRRSSDNFTPRISCQSCGMSWPMGKAIAPHDCRSDHVVDRNQLDMGVMLGSLSPFPNVCNCGSHPDYEGWHILPCRRPNRI